MEQCKYLIAGSSHAGLSAMNAIVVQDPGGPITLLTREDTLPYSPTILPYVISGETEPGRAHLKEAEEFDRLGVVFRQGAEVVGVDTDGHKVTLATGEELGYEKLLLATGAVPIRPTVEGLETVPHHVLRSLDDALGLRKAGEKGNSAIVLGAGLIGMHGAENLAKAGLQVTVIEAQGQVLPDYFDKDAAGLIEHVFAEQGVKVMTGCEASRVTQTNGSFHVSLSSGEGISGDLLLVATGVKPNVDFLAGSGVRVEEGVLVDERMRSSSEDVWAAGDVAQAPGFFGPEKQLNPNLPDAVAQGRIAGMDMSEDPATKSYRGAIAMNAYGFFGHRAFSVGLGALPDCEGLTVDRILLPSSLQYQKLVFRDDRLVGASGIDSELDPGVILQLVLKRLDMEEVKGEFVASPVKTGRGLMYRMWR